MPEIGWGHTHDFFENPVEGTDALKPAGKRNIRQALLGGGEQLQGFFAAILVDGGFKIHMIGLIENPGKIIVIIAEIRGGLGKGNIAGIVSLNIG